eukprot:Plantae.Rhodophyta-Purpureofilum_apyrenoidigerum.ctg31161.p1 GENE.Plantae.Rhodophyta-Purpureofilum_apyrenoidigerum.ctg31161~~Plantae.Rhodophyta-Purpureofilum_apyrenoidigerum.ctg31161.p1  ORF type:complete len:269 (+),score=50.87 Plantae.Rhodophyta-Purpureofilum_apyrenoidigerum.ctg31161:26-808(+)
MGPVMNQVVRDIIPEIQKNGPTIASRMLEELPNRIPKAMEDMQGASQVKMNDIPDLIRQEAANIFRKTPEGLETPDYEVLYKDKGYEVRKYANFSVAETAMSMSEGGNEMASAQASSQGFNTLAKYLFGDNVQKEKMSMTTPVIIEQSNSAKIMSFVLPSKYTSSNAPTPKTGDVQVREAGNGIYAARTFPGLATEGEVQRQLTKLQRAIEDNPNLRRTDLERYQLLQYNPPYTLPWLRQNEILVSVLYTGPKRGVPERS